MTASSFLVECLDRSINRYCTYKIRNAFVMRGLVLSNDIVIATVSKFEITVSTNVGATCDKDGIDLDIDQLNLFLQQLEAHCIIFTSGTPWNPEP